MLSGSAQTVADAAATPTVGSLWATHRWNILRWSSPVLLVVLWQLFSATGLIPGDVLPAPREIDGEADVEGEDDVDEAFADDEIHQGPYRTDRSRIFTLRNSTRSPWSCSAMWPRWFKP